MITKKEQQEELDRCKNSFEYFYNNYYKRDSMPEFSQEAWEEYLESSKKQKFSRRRGNSFYPSEEITLNN